MATIRWIPISGTDSFNTPANWQGGVVPGVNDIAEFNSGGFYTVTGNATVGEIIDNNDDVTLTGTIATSGTQSTELLIENGAFLTIASGAAVTGNELVQLGSSGVLTVDGTLTAGTIAVSGFFYVAPTATVTGVIALDNCDLQTGGNITLNNVIQVLATSDLSANLTLAGALNGNGTLVMYNGFGDGTDVISGPVNRFTGGITINSGMTLVLAPDAVANTLTGAVTDDGTLAISDSSAVTLSGVISGTGTLVQEGTGTTTLTNDNTYTGGTTIEGGTLELVQSTGASTGTITFAPGADATLQIDGTAGLTTPISGFAPGDSIDLANIAATSFIFPYQPGFLAVSFTVGNTTTDYFFQLSTTGGDDFVLGPDGEGGTRFTSVPVLSDFTGDGKSDVLLNNVNGAFTDWEMSGLLITAGPTLTSGGSPEMITPAMSIAGIGDFTGTGPAGILVQNGDGTFTEWATNGAQITASPSLTYLGNVVALPASAYSVVGIGDFNGDGKDDILLRNTNGSFTDWTMNGSVIANSQVLTYQGSTVLLPTSYSVVGIGDFNGSGEDDVLLRSSTGSFTDWTMNGSQIVSSQLLTYLGNPVMLNSSWSVAGVGDFTGTGQDDILLRNTNGTFTVWTMNGAQIVSSQVVTDGGNPVVLDPSWSVVEIGDFDNTGQDDILLRNTNGLFTEWILNGSAQIAGGGNVAVNGNPNPVMLPGSWQTDANPATGGGSGTQIVGAGESLTNPIIGGGTLDLQSGAAINGMISFAPGTSGTLYDADQATDTVVGFAEGTDYLSFLGENAATVASVVASAQSVSGNTVLSLPDHTSITLLGVSQIDAGIFA